MESPLLMCPICTKPGFHSVDALWKNLIRAATVKFSCPVCFDDLRGLDKFTIHLFSHTMLHKEHCQYDEVKLTQQVNSNLSFEQSALSNGKEKVPHSSAIRLPKVKVNMTNPKIKGCKNVIAKFVFDENRSNYEACRKEHNATTQSKFKPYDTGEPIEKNVYEEDDRNFKKSSSFQDDGLLVTSSSIKSVENVTNPLVNNKVAECSQSLICHGSNESLEKLKCIVDDTSYYTCDVCSFSFPEESILQMHKELIHSDLKNKSKNMILENNQNQSLDSTHIFSCHLCLKSFRMRGSLMVHLRVAHSGVTTGRLKSLNINNKEMLEERRSYVCSICDKPFKKEQHLTQHMKTHESKQWACDVCNKMFTTKYFLKKHKRLHTGEMPYRCGICDKTFTFQQSYHKHLLYHSDEKPHVCSECDRAFKELSTLHNHQRIHTGEKPFACETCGKCFRQRVSYLVHRRIHTGAMPYKCTACGKNFRYKVSQRTHKCPSYPPGTVVRQSIDLVQKLRQAVKDKCDQKVGRDVFENVVAQNNRRMEDEHLKQFCIMNNQHANQYIIMIDDVNETPLSQNGQPTSSADLLIPGDIEKITFNEKRESLSPQKRFSGKNEFKKCVTNNNDGQMSTDDTLCQKLCHKTIGEQISSLDIIGNSRTMSASKNETETITLGNNSICEMESNEGSIFQRTELATSSSEFLNVVLSSLSNCEEIKKINCYEQSNASVAPHTLLQRNNRVTLFNSQQRHDFAIQSPERESCAADQKLQLFNDGNVGSRTPLENLVSSSLSLQKNVSQPFSMLGEEPFNLFYDTDA